MHFKISNRQFLSVAVIFLYLIPLLFFAILSMTIVPLSNSWTLFTLGVLLAIVGTFALTLLLYYWDNGLEKISPTAHEPWSPAEQTKSEPKITSLEHLKEDNLLAFHEPKELNFLETALRVNQDKQEEFAKSLEMKIQELEKQVEENKQLELKAFQIAQDFADYKLFSEEQLKQKQMQISTFQQMLEEQRGEMEKRQEQIYQLDTKIHDLSYEIKTLLYIHEDQVVAPKPLPAKEGEFLQSNPKPNHPMGQGQATPISSSTPQHEKFQILDYPVRTSVEAAALLRKCINMAQKLTSANYHSSEASRYREYTSSFSTIDQRRLFDNLRDETGALIVVYSLKENKLLFANNESKNLLGWNPEKFIGDFSSIVPESINDWKKALCLLANASESQARILAKTKQGQEVILDCHFGLVPTGLFRHHAIGILYPA